jgi:hypothetical protein
LPGCRAFGLSGVVGRALAWDLFISSGPTSIVVRRYVADRTAQKKPRREQIFDVLLSRLDGEAY